MTKPKTPEAIEELLDPTSTADRAASVARFYRQLGLSVIEAEEVQIGQADKDSDPVIVNGQFVVDEDGEAKLPGSDHKVRSYRQHVRKLRQGMAAYRKKHADNWALVTEKVEELKKQG